MTAPPKQTLHHAPALIALGEALHLLPHHTKPYRRRHVLFLAVSIVFMGVMLVELATVITRRSLDPRALFSAAATAPAIDFTAQVRSSNGFSFVFDTQYFTATALGDGLEGSASDAELAANRPLTSVKLSPLPSRVPAHEAASEFEVRVETDKAAFATYKAAAPPRTDISAITAGYFAPKATNSADIAEQIRTTEPINGTLMTKTVYKITPKFAGSPTHTIVWSAEIAGKPTAITVRGIVMGTAVPSTIVPVLQSVILSSNTKVQGLSITRTPSQPPVIEQKYVADLVSPAVVKVYHLVCGTLVYNNQAISEDTCNGSAGSGFFVSSDGYIATNGHVVVYGAKDMLVNALLSDDRLLTEFLQAKQLNATQVAEVLSRPELTASVVSGIYDLPDEQLRLMNQRELTVIATGTTPLDLSDEAQVKKLLIDFAPTSDLKQATVVGYDYSAKDQLTVVSDPEKGFSASDVALLKISAENTPLIRIAPDGPRQNQDISVFGFPVDADNALTDNSMLGVSVTGGAISSIRDAAGSASKLYQSDVDASQGNSGGPAVDDTGKVFGVLTYRFASGEVADAPKSYIRDIADFTNLVTSKDVTLNTNSSTLTAWERGLDNYSKHHYSAALVDFKRVQQLYPAHRLAGTYIELSLQAIKDGKDIKEIPATLLVFGVITGLGGLLMAVAFIARHHGHHRVYRAYHQHAIHAG